MSLYSFYRISKPSEGKVAPEAVEGEYRHLRNCTFWGVTGAYALYYVCRMAMSVVKQPLIDGGIFTAAQLGIIGSAFYFVYAFGKFVNGFIAARTATLRASRCTRASRPRCSSSSRR